MQAGFPDYQVLRSPLPLVRAGGAELVQRIALAAGGEATLRLSGDTLSVSVEGASVSTVHLALHSGPSSCATLLLGHAPRGVQDPVPVLWSFDLAHPQAETGPALFALRLAAVSAPMPQAPQIDGMTLPYREAVRADLAILRPSLVVDMPAARPETGRPRRSFSFWTVRPAPERPFARAAPVRPSAHRAAAPTGSRS
jgi:hypothetical protein